MTPSVALRALYEQMRSFEAVASAGRAADVHRHFVGPITPPGPNVRRPIGDPVFDAIADYTSKVVARAGFLTKSPRSTDDRRSDEYGRLTRALYAVEHSLAVDLGRVTPDIPLRHRQISSRAVLAVAAFWGDRDRLLRLSERGVHPLLGGRPDDDVGAVLWENATLALAPPRRPASGGGGLGGSNEIDLGIGLGLVQGA